MASRWNFEKISEKSAEDNMKINTATGDVEYLNGKYVICIDLVWHLVALQIRHGLLGDTMSISNKVEKRYHLKMSIERISTFESLNKSMSMEIDQRSAVLSFLALWATLNHQTKLIDITEFLNNIDIYWFCHRMNVADISRWRKR